MAPAKRTVVELTVRPSTRVSSFWKLSSAMRGESTMFRPWRSEANTATTCP